MVRGKSGVTNDTHNQHDDGRSTDPPIQISLLAVGPYTCSNRHGVALYLLEPSLLDGFLTVSAG